MKKIIAVLTGVVLLLTCLIISASAEEAPVAVERGVQVELIVSVDACAGIKSGSIAFTYDEAVFEIVSGEWLVNEPLISDFNATSGKGVFAYAGAVQVSGNIFRLVLRVKADAAFGMTDVSAGIQLKNNSTGEIFTPHYAVRYNVTCDHRFSDTYRSDENEHWRVCVICEGTADGGRADWAEHVFDNACDAVCDICGFERAIHHVYSADWTVDVNPTCTTVGSKSHHCLYCDAKGDVTVIPANGHRFGEWYEIQAPTCTATGRDERACTMCHSTETRTAPAKGHTPAEATVENKIDPTCTLKGGYDSVVYCSACDAELSRERRTVNKLGHEYAADWTVDLAPTCTTVGSKSHHCSRCDAKADITVIPANGHRFGEWYEIQAPTCTATGRDERACTVCQSKETRTTAAKGHTPADAVVENKLDATCTADGSYDSVVYCSVCDAELLREDKIIDKLGHDYAADWTVDLATCTEVGSQSHHCSRCDAKADVTVIPANGHRFGEWYEIQAPTCTATGTDERACTVCQSKETRTTAAKGHTPADAVVENKLDATCTAEGSYDSVVYCSVCDAELLREDKIIDKLGHDYAADWTVDLAPTCTEVGSQSHHCSRCDAKADVTVIPANGHRFGEWYEIQAPTCTATGRDERACTVCQSKETRTTAAKGHTPADAVVENKLDATCTAEGSYDSVVYCSVCDAELLREDKIIDKLGHDYAADWTVDLAPTCTEVGSQSHHCSRCDAKADVTVIPANGHRFGEWYEIQAPTCTATGTDERACTVCQSKETRTTAAKGHTPSDAVVENWFDATCTAEGSYDSVVYCSVCDAELLREDKIIDKLGHDYAADWTVDLAPTCTEVGSQSHHCSRCDAKADVTVIPANGHRFGEWYEIQAPTCTATGRDERACTVCQSKETRTTAAKGHTPADAVVENKLDATCTAEGSYDSVVYCSVCDAELLREDKIIDKLGHDYAADWTVDLAPTCTEVGSQSHHCSRCDAKADVTEIPANGHVYDDDSDASCNECGETREIESVGTETDEVTEEQTTASAETEGESTANDTTAEGEKSGCQSTLGASVFIMIAVAVAGLGFVRKKEEYGR